MIEEVEWREKAIVETEREGVAQIRFSAGENRCRVGKG